MIIASRRPALALVAVPREFPDLVARAELIVVGTVTAIRNASNADGVPFTVVALGDLAVAKGSVDGPTYDLWMYGGTVGDVVVGVPDAPTFAVGERYVLFIHGNRREVFPLVGVGHGQFHLRYDSQRAAEIVEDSDGRPVVGLRGRRLQRRRAAVATGAPALTLSEFRDLIDAELQRTGIPTP